MSHSLAEILAHLAATPLAGLALTLLAYQVALALYARANFHPLVNPVAVSITIVITVLVASGTSYATYFDSARFIHFLLGPATVALAIPLYQQIEKLKRNWFALLSATLVGASAAIAVAMGAGWLLGASRATIMSLAPKAVTTPIAMGIAEKIGGLPSLTAALVIATGILGAVSARGILNLMKVDDPSVRGFALGTAAHGIGTARAFQVSQEMGAFSGLAMGMSGVLTALLLPLALKLLGLF
jgi:predicted murein hydrolase (TIGR00659 family)